MTIKLFGLIPRKSDLTREEFHDYYRHPHGTIGRHMSLMRGYVQSHQMDTEVLGEEQLRFDAVAEVWLDNEQDALGFRNEPVMVEHLVEDELKFVDMSKLAYLFATQEVLASGPRLGIGLSHADEIWSPANRPVSVKLLCFVASDGSPSWAQPGDAELGFRLGALRHVRCHPVHALHADGAAFLGVQELWWPTRADFHRGVKREPAALAALLANAGRSVTMLVQAERFI